MRASVIGSMLSKGLDVAMKRRFGFDLWELCTKPRLARKIPKTERARLAHDVAELLRHAGTDAGRHAALPPKSETDRDAVRPRTSSSQKPKQKPPAVPPPRRDGSRAAARSSGARGRNAAARVSCPTLAAPGNERPGVGRQSELDSRTT
jgi:hypothetical protein